MEQKHSCATVCDGLPTLSANHPWLVDDNLKVQDYNRDHIFYTTRDPPSQQRFRIPSFLGRRIRGCFHGWVILSNPPQNDKWSLWNPVTCKIIRLPCLRLRNRDPGLDYTQQCCLSSPPDDHGSIFMLTTKNQAIVFCRLDSKRKRLKWLEMSYAGQVRSIDGYDGFLSSLTCCNGKVYAINSARRKLYVIHIDIVVMGTEVVITLLPYLKIPRYYMHGCVNSISFLNGCCTELFYIELICRDEVGHVAKETFGGMSVFKLDMNKKNLRWKRMEDLKDAAFFFDLAHGYSVFYSPAIASGLGGYVHFLDRSGKVIHSYDFKNKTIALSSMPTSHASLLSEHRLPHGEIQSLDKENIETGLLNIPLDVLKTIMEFCVGVEYLNFRATCKQCHLAAPMIRWSKGGRLPTPWLMVLHKDRGVISFTDPMFGDEYFIKTPPELIGDVEIHCSMHGWLLIRRRMGRRVGRLMFFNPFTSDIRELPWVPYLESFCFSAPPTSSDCMVVGFPTQLDFGWRVYITFVAQRPAWRIFPLNVCYDRSHSFQSPIIYSGLNQYALYNNGRIYFIDTDNGNYTWRQGPIGSCVSPEQTFLLKCDQQLLLVIVGKFEEPVEVFELNDYTGWEKTDSLGRHSIYISGKKCLCIEAKTPAMANKIYFLRVHSENRKIVFYSLETRRYHTSDINESFGDFVETKHHLDPHVWIEPSWS